MVGRIRSVRVGRRERKSRAKVSNVAAQKCIPAKEQSKMKGIKGGEPSIHSGNKGRNTQDPGRHPRGNSERGWRDSPGHLCTQLSSKP